MQKLIHGKVEERKAPAEQWHNVVFSTIHEAEAEELEGEKEKYNQEMAREKYEILTRGLI